MNKQKATS